ncbi:hypothetical protein AVEN_46856-1 [Araneus ventricosus]|uniref:Uncharacterized protein n=1 Tax=Araneus ventricosus TaxID=182803 RepID=A0A4Y2CLM5_ARAVE|nr:hypothetical protein AVEN_46856-1 [Araneus ventricosus]
METDLPSHSDDESEIQIPITPASKVDETDYNNSKSKWPCIWIREMCDRKKDAFPWLDCQNGKLGCTICKKISHLGAFTKERIGSTSKEWFSFTVSFHGSTKSSQLAHFFKKKKFLSTNSQEVTRQQKPYQQRQKLKQLKKCVIR